MEINVVQKVMKLNDDIAARVRARFDAAGVTAFNFISAPGSGKTTLIETTLARLVGERAVGVLEGDPDTDLDARRIAQFDVPVSQIVTSGACHLEANLVDSALNGFDLGALDVVFIENVGNLVCPVEFDLGETCRVAVVSTPEGHDKPAKYPKLFRVADVVVLNKIDLLPYVAFDRTAFRDHVYKANPEASLIELSCQSGEGVDAWMDWLLERAPRKETHAAGSAP